MKKVCSRVFQELMPSRSKSLCKAAKRRRNKEQGAVRHWLGSIDKRGILLLPDAQFTPPYLLFQKYYRLQNIVPQDTFKAFLHKLYQPLPVTFRMTLQATQEFTIRGKELLKRVAAIHLAPMHAFQLNIDKHALRAARPGSVEFSIRSWLIEGTEVGYLVRQELASMLPPYLLQPSSSSRVIDLCASPGSKTTQAVDLMRRASLRLNDMNDIIPIHGLVVANDSDHVRSFTLAKRCSGLKEAAGSVLIPCHQAQRFPNISEINAKMSDGFTHIICDVPCSGDGTTRKHPEVFGRWEPRMALAHHSMQLSIAMRGAALLSIGGTMVYSTCSFNPIENEAVVHELICRCGGALVIENVRTHLKPLMNTSEGLLTWRVAGAALEPYADCASARAATSCLEYERNLFVQSMWPPKVEADGRRIGLNLCARLHPHESDTGGFFVALLRKVAPLPREAKPRDQVSWEASSRELDTTSSPLRREFLTALQPINRALISQLGLRHNASSQLFVKSESARTVFYVSPLALDVSRHNRLRIVRAGAAVFRRLRSREASWSQTPEGQFLGIQK